MPMVRGAVFAAVAILMAMAPAWSQAPGKPGAERSAQQWINQLADNDYRKRDEATSALEKMGTAALPALRAARKHNDPEIRRRVNELIPVIEVATILAPRLINLQVSQKTSQEIVAELSKHTGYRIDCFGSNDNAKYDFSWNKVPFWQAIDHLCRAAGLVVQTGYGDDHVRLMKQDRFAPYVCYQGAFRITASRFQHLRSIDFSTFPQNNTVPPRSDNLTFSFTVFAEPRLPLLGVNEINLTAAYDNENNSLVPSPDPPGSPDGGGQRNRMSRYGSGQRMCSSPADVNLARPSAKATVAKLLRGKVSLTLLADQKPEVVTDKLFKTKNQKVKLGTTTIVIEEVSETPAKQYQVKLSVTEDDPGNDYTWSNSLYYRMEVQDEKGQKLPNYGSSWSSNGTNNVRITMTFGQGGGNPNPGKPAKLIYHVWTTLQHQVPFEFQDLPLP